MAVPHVFCLCYVCGVATFVFLFVSLLVGGQGLLGQERYLSASMNPLIKAGDRKYRRNVFTVTRLEGVLIATTAYCHWEARGDVLRTAVDNVEVPKLSVNTGRDRRRGV